MWEEERGEAALGRRPGQETQGWRSHSRAPQGTELADR